MPHGMIGTPHGVDFSFPVLSEFGRYPLCFHWWQQILRYHNRINNLSDDERLIQCAFVEGMHDKAYRFWSHCVQKWLQSLGKHSLQL